MSQAEFTSVQRDKILKHLGYAFTAGYEQARNIVDRGKNPVARYKYGELHQVHPSLLDAAGYVGGSRQGIKNAILKNEVYKGCTFKYV